MVGTILRVSTWITHQTSQALSELANVCLGKLRPRLSAETVEREVEKLIHAFPVIPLTALVALEALRGVREHRMAYYDAQIWAFARLGQVPIVLSEDFNSGATVEGVRFLDPLREGFEVGSLG